jgi:hypothetical protein
MVVLHIGSASSGRNEEVDAAPEALSISTDSKEASGRWRELGQAMEIERWRGTGRWRQATEPEG